jgi:hypothetical protein
MRKIIGSNTTDLKTLLALILYTSSIARKERYFSSIVSNNFLSSAERCFIDGNLAGGTIKVLSLCDCTNITKLSINTTDLMEG